MRLAPKIKKIPEKKLMQVIAPVVVILIILFLFGIYHLVVVYKAEQPLPTTETEAAQPETGIITCEDLGCPDNSHYIASSESNVYHDCDSGYAMSILPQNRVCFYNATEAEAAGYRAAAK